MKNEQLMNEQVPYELVGYNAPLYQKYLKELKKFDEQMARMIEITQMPPQNFEKHADYLIVDKNQELVGAISIGNIKPTSSKEDLEVTIAMNDKKFQTYAEMGNAIEYIITQVKIGYFAKEYIDLVVKNYINLTTTTNLDLETPTISQYDNVYRCKNEYHQILANSLLTNSQAKHLAKTK